MKQNSGDSLEESTAKDGAPEVAENIIPAFKDSDAVLTGHAINTLHKVLDKCVQNGDNITQTFHARWSDDSGRPAATVRAYKTLKPENIVCRNLLLYIHALTGKFPESSVKVTYVPARKEDEEPSYKVEELSKEEKAIEKRVDWLMGYGKDR